MKPTFTNSSGLKSVFEKFRFRGGLVKKVGLTIVSNFSGVTVCTASTGPKISGCLSDVICIAQIILKFINHTLTANRSI